MTDEERQQLFDLIKQAKEGKQSAFTKLYEKYNRIIYSTIYRIVKSKCIDGGSSTFGHYDYQA